ncbi:MAG TPA: Uma2 family endonuclease [Chloroflexia bacterium]|jgi:Uma2 family endonuclease
MATQQAPHLFTVDEYYRMGEAGILSEDARVELIEGEIIDMAPIGMRHALCVNRLNQLLVLLLQGRAMVHVQNPLHLGDYSEPQPDITLLKQRDYSHDLHNPGANDVLLAIEVSDTTLTFDRKVKVPLYARAGIPEVWLVNLQEDSIEVYSQPGGGTYQEHQQLGRGQSVPVPGFSDLTASINDIFGR